jgi:hypothetical protein
MATIGACYDRSVIPADLLASIAWYSAATPEESELVCKTRDVFQARLDTLLRELMRAGWSVSDSALVVAVLGEIGNNSYDHNLGRWPDAAGCWFGRATTNDPPLFWITDRGVGLLATLRRADPTIRTPDEAIEAAFARVLSGRAPERRGNGLKFVRSVVNAHPTRSLVACSGGATARFGSLQATLPEAASRLAAAPAPGVAAILAWRST